MSYASRRSVSHSDFTKSGGLTYLNTLSKRQRAYASAVAAANEQILNHVSRVSKSNNNKQSALGKLAQRFKDAISSVW